MSKTHKEIRAIAVFQGKIKGAVYFTETKNGDVAIELQLSGLKKNHSHGFHIHEYGDMSENCESMCAHFNPYGKTHGGPTDSNRHVGDLGNIDTDMNGNARYVFTDSAIKLRGTKSNIIGRGLVIHADTDDLGHGNDSMSKITGNAGKRIACAVIGYARPDPNC
jgi:Cu-Zn family superoxide dismutase